MILTQKYVFTALACLSFAVIPVVRSATIDVVVGGPGILKYSPEFVNASVGDIIRFTFKQKNHTVTQSTLQSPCSPKADGFDSDFVPVADSVTQGFPVAQFTVENADPLWVYCRQANHCQQGMVFAVNPGDKFEAFKAAATGNTTSTTTSTSTSTSATSTAPAGSSKDHRVVVGGPGVLAFQPANITAQVGDTVTFEFRQKNHTVTQSSFNQPCQALSATGQPGFDTGFHPVADGSTTFPTYTIQVNDTKPIWAYCRQANHCTSGMVFSVNSVETGPNTFEAFKSKAMGSNGTSGSNNQNAGISTRLNSASIAIAVVGVVFGVLC
ncbi:hypothetical protein E1B28_002501 [Marasmius oreades]|uniref:Cupredoxin n=1 Tax=Marasmius oreades TaxID=181124 RepID=A0A9P7UKS0_9AGAR|nr:uncharacterized protein E1B28_002501 [Marasmius oreades]KAG7086552.1 hypothetical protein E1B28_002501 [Marasmius oreades]